MSDHFAEDIAKTLQEGNRRAEEDRALEEKILQDRKERQARREERARSISPQKSSPANTPPPSARRTSTRSPEQHRFESSPILDPPTSSQSRELSEAESMTDNAPYPSSPTKENVSPVNPDSKRGITIGSPTRTSSSARGLNWQRRPNSQSSNGPRSRPLSMVAAENAARSSSTLTEPTSANESTFSRDQISQALSSKDPSWFRQTADRGATSGAYRKNQVEDTEKMDLSSIRAQLPGMARGPSPGAFKNSFEASSNAPASGRALGSPLPITSAQRLDPPSSNHDQPAEADTTQERQLMTSPPLGRTSPTRMDRPGSPTKGMGGFVQSAMMKRSESIKRWSVQSPPGLQRADSINSGRGSQIDSNRTSTATLSRPSSSVIHESPDESVTSAGTSLKLDTGTPKLPTQEAAKATPPSSPSKTMDQRRWSPTKSSWLESALNKPESPKPKHAPHPSNQPAWMVDLAKAKAQKANNPGAVPQKSPPPVSHKHEISIGGLMRSTAPGITTNTASASGSHRSTASMTTANRAGLGNFGTMSQSSVSGGVGDVESSSPTASTPPAGEPNAIKTKPDTPPKKDFRSSLKSRPPPGSNAEDDGSELKNLLGNLRRTTTQNYKAPDEFKNNILRGKAALNLTGGPKKSERKDEFKEAILAKKKDFQKAVEEGRGIHRNSSSAGDKPIPEGLARRLELGHGRRNGSGASQSSIERRGSASTISPIESPRPGMGFKRDSASAMSSKDSPRATLSSRHDSVSAVSPQESPRPAIGSKRDSGSATSPKESPRVAMGLKRDSAQDIAANHAADKAPAASTVKENVAPGRLPGKLGGGALADRFNPALAGLIARGRPPMGGAPAGGSGHSPRSSSTKDEGEPGPGPKLTHMTKGRARGPKRHAPTHLAAATHIEQPSQPSVSQLSKDDKPPTPPPGVPLPDPFQEVKKPSSGAAPKSQSTDSVATQKISSETPASPSKEHARSLSKGRMRSQSKVHDQIAAFAARSNSPTKVSEPERELPRSSSPSKINVKQMSKFMDDSSQGHERPPSPEKPTGVKSPFLTQQTTITPRAFEKPSSPENNSPSKFSSNPQSSPMTKPLSQSPPKKFESASAVSPTNDSHPLGPRALPSSQAREPLSTKPLPKPQADGPVTPVKNKPLPSLAIKPPVEVEVSPLRSPTKHAAEIAGVLNEFFGPDRQSKSFDVDAAETLMKRPNMTSPRIQTINARLYNFSADGKKSPVSASQERTLFEQEIYLGSHTFTNEAGKKVSEVYFWAGDDVPPAAVEDASLFVSKEARSMGGKLIKMQQGKETAEFLAALGGIVITQRGSSNKYDSLAPHMLCARRYLGQIVFDEVDFSPLSLCSGFAYLVTSAGRCVLWKGKGSGVDELSCARLIGMEYALSGEMNEIEDGREPLSFWRLFESADTRVGSADHWRLKPNYDGYCCRLFVSDAATKQQIIELSPFSQSDMKPNGIYILDAFFELYIVVGSQAQPQYASFHNALHFAQEYAILAAGMEDRPFVPISTVVLEGIPRDMKSVFRRWRDSDSPTVMPATMDGGTGLRRGRSLRVVPLNQALLALKQ